jgi:uncharacterized protein YecE (DUF72 family)
MIKAGAAIHLGTSSWQFDGWRGAFYPPSLSTNRYLAHYVTHFNSVEVNTSFYALPRPSTLVDWVEVAPPGFTFALKAPRRITHELRLVQTETESRAFIETIRALGVAAGPALIQLPAELSRRNHGRSIASYFDWLAEEAISTAGLRVAVEVRAEDLLTPAFARYLAQRGMTLALADRKGAPDMFDTWSEILAAGIAPDFAYVRWIGDDRHGPQGDSEPVLDRSAELDQWANRLLILSQAGVEVYGYVHNPYEGHAPATVRRLTDRLVALGATVATATQSASQDETGQMKLF